MSGEVKDLAYYQANPSEIGNLSEDQLDQLAAQGDTGAEQEPESGEPPAAAAEAAEKPNDDKATDTPAAPIQDETPKGIATKDGKHIIPFEVLEKQRSRVSELERIAQEQAAKIEALTSQAQGKDQAAEQGAITVLTDAELADLEQELPAIAKAIRIQQEQLQSLNETVRTLNAAQQERQQQDQRTVTQTVQEAIDGNPKLAYLQAQDPDIWARAVRFDATLRQDPDWASKGFADRFTKVVELYEATYGPVNLPGQTTPPSQPSPADLAKQAEATLKSKKPPVPASLSDIPGGATPAADDVIGALTTKSGPELTADFMRMTPQQIEATLARL